MALDKYCFSSLSLRIPTDTLPFSLQDVYTAYSQGGAGTFNGSRALHCPGLVE